MQAASPVAACQHPWSAPRPVLQARLEAAEQQAQQSAQQSQASPAGSVSGGARGGQQQEQQRSTPGRGRSAMPAEELEPEERALLQRQLTSKQREAEAAAAALAAAQAAAAQRESELEAERSRAAALGDEVARWKDECLQVGAGRAGGLGRGSDWGGPSSAGANGSILCFQQHECKPGASAAPPLTAPSLHPPAAGEGGAGAGSAPGGRHRAVQPAG